MLLDLERAKIVITNYHAFKRRERLELSKGGRALLQGRGAALSTLESEGQMLQRVMPELLGMKHILALNDEAHHCYREKLGADAEAGSGRDGTCRQGERKATRSILGQDQGRGRQKQRRGPAVDLRSGGGGPQAGPQPGD